MRNQETDKKFLGIGWGFPPEFNRHLKEVKMVSEDEDIHESLRILLSTRLGERLMHPTYGCGLHEMVFENLNESTITEIKDRVQRAILFFEPRIDVDGIFVESEDWLNGELRILLNYTIRTTNARSNMVYPFYREGANLGFRASEQAP
jgi:phage baseplate assembly protein W